MAAALGEGATTAVDDTMHEFVARPHFVEEVQKLLEGAEERTEVLQMQLDQREVGTSHLFRIRLLLECIDYSAAMIGGPTDYTSGVLLQPRKIVPPARICVV